MHRSQAYSFTDFNKPLYLRNPYAIKREYFHQPRVPCAPLSQHSSPPCILRSNYGCDFCHIVLTILQLSINGITQYIVFCISLPS